MTARRAASPLTASLESNNAVFLRGRLAADPAVRELPSGDELCVFRLTVDRPDGERVRVDSIECSTVRPRVRTALLRAAPGDQIEVVGRLRRRFWRGAGGLGSRYEVAVETARLSSRVTARRRSAASPSQKRASG